MKSLKALPLIAALFAFAFLIAASDAAIASCRRGLKLCAELIVPSLFPFFVLSGLLNRLGLPSYIGKYLAPAASKLYGISGAGASALIVGLCGGYPMGAAYVADMRQSGAVSEQEAERLLAFCNNSGPAFIIGAIGAGVFRSGITGLQLYLIHILSALLTGLFFRDGSYSAESQPLLIDTELPTAAILDAVGQALRSILSVCGFVVCFSVLTGMLDAFGALSAVRFSCAQGWSGAALYPRPALRGAGARYGSRRYAGACRNAA